MLTPHHLLVLWSRKSRATPLLPLWACTEPQCLYKRALHLYLYQINTPHLPADVQSMANLQNNWQNISLSHMHFRQTHKQLQAAYNFCQLCDYIIVHVLSCCLLNTEDHGHFMWDLWCIKWYRDRSFLEHLAFLLSIQFQQCFLFYSFANCVMNSGCNCSCIFPPHKKLKTISSTDCPQVLFISLLNS